MEASLTERLRGGPTSTTIAGFRPAAASTIKTPKIPMSAILKTPNVPLARAWNTWGADRYLEMGFRPLGLRISPMLFSAKTARAIYPGPGSTVRLGTHATDASDVRLEIDHAGTRLAWRWRKLGLYDLEGGWSTMAHGEWALRFWIGLVLWSDEGGIWRYDEASGTATWTHAARTVAVRAEHAPLLVTAHATPQALAEEYEKLGYWHLASRATEAPLLALRFNLEEAARNRFAVAIADRADLAIARAAEVIAEAPTGSQPPECEATGAVRDIMGWNTIWDQVNHRPYISCSRNWDLKKFGGFGFWLNDTAVNALLVSLCDADQARESIATLLYGATPEGNLPCLLTGNDAWVDRTQNPLVAFIAWQVYQRTGSRPLLEAAYPILARNNAWLRRMRDGNGNGLLEFGSSRTGQGLYAGTKLAAKDESFMDNSPMHDEACWNEASRTLDCEDVGLNSLASLDCQILASMARELGLAADADRHQKAADALNALIAQHLWDDSRKIFSNRLWSGRFVRSLSPTSFLPLLCGAASKERKRHLLRHLDDPKLFGGTFVLPSISRDDPAYADNVYWRGRIWPILNWLVWHGLQRERETQAAERLAERSWAMFKRTWDERREAPENYNAETGEGLDQADTDPFYSWTGLIPYMRIASLVDVSPWTGLTLHVAGPDTEEGPLLTPLGRVVVRRTAGTLTVTRSGDEILRLVAAGSVTHVSHAGGTLRLELPPGSGPGELVRLSGTGDRKVMTAQQDGEPIEARIARSAIEIVPRASKERRRILLVLDRP
jgi:putative isomerase